MDCVGLCTTRRILAFLGTNIVWKTVYKGPCLGAMAEAGPAEKRYVNIDGGIYEHFNCITSSSVLLTRAVFLRIVLGSRLAKGVLLYGGIVCNTRCAGGL